jgi:tRNA (cmo5U34)-methyltransferase
MTTQTKSTVDDIRRRFDNDVERFSNLETGQTATIDAPLVLELITQAATTATPNVRDSLDIGCGAGNYTLKLLQLAPTANASLIDLSKPMLDRATQRVSAATSGQVRALQGDVRELELGEAQFDVIMAAAVFHHLRDDDDWRHVFSKCYAALRPGGSIWISDLIFHSTPAVQALMWKRYGEYLTALKGESYRDQVFNYIEMEDTPRPLLFQIDMLRTVGFNHVEILHKNSTFAAFGAIK